MIVPYTGTGVMEKSTRSTAVILTISLIGAGFLFAADLSRRVPNQPAKTGKAQTAGPKESAAIPKRVLHVPPVLLKEPPVTYRFNEPGDLIELIPIVRDINRMIPRRFSLANHQFVLSSNQMVINHQFFDARARASSKTSVISFSYSGGVGHELTTQLDVPLFYSSLSNFAEMSAYPFGNYTMTINRDYRIGNSLYIRAQTRF